jgi:7,8-dihydropterin-6-yl-methyl-4-(beta-D-ribofuranosyl)aminobenzene 5'-phosphate synthase
VPRVVCVVDNHAEEGPGLKSEHSAAFWTETPAGNVLFETGQTESVLSHNLAALGLRLEAVNALAFSHAHYDHTGGLRLLMAAGRCLPL